MHAHDVLMMGNLCYAMLCCAVAVLLLYMRHSKHHQGYVAMCWSG